MGKPQYLDDEWRVIRQSILERDDYSCAICKRVGGKLEIHHIVSRKRGGADHPDNLITLCSDCHRRVPKQK